MKINKLLATCLICLFSSMLFAQKSNVWLTYGQSKFLYSPGAEFNIFINQHIGFQVGVSTYFQAYDENKIVNSSDANSFNFHNANIGLCSHILNKGEHKFGTTIGCKMYYGPEFKILHYYTNGGYNIYFDSSELRPDYGIDMGLFYSYKKITGLLKFDTARKKIRLGIGYSFGSLKAQGTKAIKINR